MNGYKIGLNKINVIDELVENIKLSLKNKNYFAALFFSLALPDICGKIYLNSLGEHEPKSKERYTRWIDKFVNSSILNTEKHNPVECPYLEALQYYKIRCGLYHQGELDFVHDGDNNVFILKDIEFIARLENPGCDAYTIEKSGAADKSIIEMAIDISRFCNLIIWGVDKFKIYLKDFDAISQPIINIKCY